jgi:hypothetical protein
LIDLWPNEPFVEPGVTPEGIKDLIFPSGRQAISHAIELLGGRREWLAVIPEYSGHCLISAVAKKVMPLPITQADQCPDLVKIALLYCQWGWERPSEAVVEVCNRFPQAKLILDRVDSLAASLDELPLRGVAEGALQVFSLSKTLGLEGGGLLFSQGTWSANKNAGCEEDKKLAEEVWGLRERLAGGIAWDMVKAWYMADMRVLPPWLCRWLDTNDLNTVLKSATDARIARRRIVIDCIDELGWPRWMIDQMGERSRLVPGIIPLFLKHGANANLLRMEIKAETDLQLEIYHFDISTSYLKPDWRPCLAVPLHGQISTQDLDWVIQYWAKSHQRARA